MKSLIYGYGITGKSFERYLKKKNIDYDIYDKNINTNIPKLDCYKTIYCSPGVDRKTFELLKSSTKVLTDIDIFLQEDTSIKIGISGTNRKSTTCYHLHQIFQRDAKTNLIGNIGEPMLDYINNGSKYSIIELSSFQLDKAENPSLDYGILLDITPDHLDYHETFEDYKKAKHRLLKSRNTSYEDDPYKLYEWISGRSAAVQDLKDLPFRFQKISSSIINDSKSTNSNSLEYAVDKANQKFGINNYFLLLCGDPKKEQFKNLDISGPEAILIFGAHKNEIENCISHSNKQIFNDLEDTLQFIKNLSLEKNILFSPGYPSGDDYKNFEERGSSFNSLVHELFNES
jgi:UDP-N-acetylmuramoylalanine--D-glutamate ligase